MPSLPFFALAACAMAADPTAAVTTVSPQGALAVTASLTEQGALTYAVAEHGKPIEAFEKSMAEKPVSDTDKRSQK